MIRIRNATPALRRGTHTVLTSSAPAVLAFVRSEGQQTVICLTNTSPDPRSAVTVTGTASTLVPGEQTLINLLDPADTLSVTVNSSFEITDLSLAGYQTAVYMIETTSDTNDDSDLPRTGLLLEPAYPNPFNPATTIRYTLPVRMHMRLSVFDVAGREKAVIRDGVEAKGSHEVNWSAVDDRGAALGAGVYFVRLSAGRDARTTEIVLIK